MNRKLVEKIHELNSFQLGYLAGLIDGEGTVFIYRRGYHRKGPFKKFPFYLSPSIAISNNCHDVLLLMKKWIGFGNLIPTKKRVHYTYSLQFSGIKRCSKIAKLLHDKCIIKNKQLKLMEEFCESRINRPYVLDKVKHPRMHSGFHVMPHRPPYDDREFEIANEIKKCNLQYSNKSRNEPIEDESNEKRICRETPE